MGRASRAGIPPIPDGWISLLPEAMDAYERAELREAIESGEQARAVRLNKINIEGLTDVFLARGERYEAVPWSERSYFLPADHTLGKHILHVVGAYYLQEPSAMAAVDALDILPGQRVLDLCAAPGGKSGQIAAKLRGQGLLVSNEPFADRMRVLRGNLVRLGVTNALMTLETPDRLAERYPAAFDRVLVDAPCSGEGLFRREPSARLEWSVASVHGCAKRQRAILRAAQSMVKPGGILVYSTCTFNRIENEETVRAFLEEYPAFSPEDYTLTGLPLSRGGMLRLMPHRVAGEGQFIARLRKMDGDAPDAGARGERAPSPNRKEQEACERFRRDALPHWYPEGTIIKIGDRLCAVNESFRGMWEAGALNIRGIGLELGSVADGQFTPAKSLALAVDQLYAADTVKLTDDESAAFMAGKAVKAGRNGAGAWTLALCRGLAVGFGWIERGRIWPVRTPR